MGIALFDLDRTLVSKDTAGLFVRYEYRHGLVSAWRVGRVAVWRALYTAGAVDQERVSREVLGWYRGCKESDLRQRTHDWFRSDVLRLVSERGRRVVAEHRARGDILVVVTASTQFVAELVATELEIPNVVCTVVDVADGVLTGRLDGPLCFGVGKLEKVRAMAESLRPKQVGLKRATLYTDSITDVPLLEAVGTPVAVNPDLRLRAMARQRGWPIHRW
jgi:HAD superfamily hydrolase (TIGR01490 family)